MTDLVTTTAMTDDVDDPSVDEDQLMNDDSFDLDLDSIMNDNASLSGVPEEEQDPVLDDILDDDEPAIDDEPTMDDIEPMIDEIDDYDDEPALVDDDDMMISSRIEEESITPIKEEVEFAVVQSTEPKKKTSSKKKKTSSKKKKKTSTKTPTKKKKDSASDPLHRLYATQTSATKHQNYKRAKEYEKSKVKEAPIWGVDEKALKKAKQLKASNTNRPSRAIEYSIEKASAKQRNAIEKKKNKAKAQILDIWGVDDKALRKASNLKTKYGNIPPSEYLRQTTNAAHHQEWLVYKELEKARRKKIKFRGVDERNIEYDQMSAPVYTNSNNKYNYSSLGNMSISSNVSNRKRRPDMIPGYFSSSHSYSDYYYSGARGRRKRASSSKPFHDRRSPSIPRDITPKIGSSSKHTNFLKKYGKTSNSTKSRNTRTTASSSSAVHANIRDVIIKDMDAQSVLTHDESENQSWIGENSYYNDDETNDQSNDDQKKEPPEKKTILEKKTPEKKATPEKKIVLEKKNTSEKKIMPKKAKKTATPKKQKKSDEKAVVPAATNPEDVKMAKESLKKVASPIKTERKKAPEPALPTSSPKKKEKKVPLQQDGPSMAPKRASDPHFAALQDKLQEEEKKVLEETKTLNKMQRLKKQTLQLFDKDKKKYSIRDILAKAPKKTRLKRGKSIQFWKKRKDLDDNKSKSKLLNISESIQEDDNSDSSDEE